MARKRSTIAPWSCGVVARLASSVTSKTQSFILMNSAAGCAGSKPLGDRVNASPFSSPASFRDFLSARIRLSSAVCFRDMVAHHERHVAIGMPNAGRNFDRIVGDAEIEPAGPQPLAAAPREGRRDMGLVGRLVRAEARIAINPEDRALGLGDILGRELSQLRVDRAHQLQHRRFHVLLEKMLARLKPLAAVVALQTPEELRIISGGKPAKAVGT